MKKKIGEHVQHDQAVFAVLASWASIKIPRRVVSTAVWGPH